MYGESSIVNLDGIAKERPYCDIEAVVMEVWILILRRDIGMEKEGLLALLVSVCF